MIELYLSRHFGMEAGMTRSINYAMTYAAIPFTFENPRGACPSAKDACYKWGFLSVKWLQSTPYVPPEWCCPGTLG